MAVLAAPASGNDKSKSPALKKIVGIGDVYTGYMGFEGLGPKKLGDLIKEKAKKELEATGRYVVVIPRIDSKKNPGQIDEKLMPKVEQGKKPARKMTAKDMQKEMARIQKMVSQMQMAMQGRHDPVAAQALFSFRVRQTKSWSDTGGFVGFAGQFTDAPVDAADFSTESLKVSLDCLQQDPDTWTLLDEHVERASKATLTRVVGTDYYSASESRDHERTYKKLFKRAMKKTIRWIDEKLQDKPWEGQVINKKGSKFYVNAGSLAGVTKGMKFGVFKLESVSGKGLDFGSEAVKKGSIEIVDVKDRYAVARLVAGEARVGYIMRISGP